MVVVGPEGGISPEELAELSVPRTSGWAAPVLRTSTAGVAAVAAVLSQNYSMVICRLSFSTPKPSPSDSSVVCTSSV